MDPAKLSRAQVRALVHCLDAPAKVRWSTAACLVPAKLLECFDAQAGLYRTTAAGSAALDALRCAACGHGEYHCLASGCNHQNAAGEYCDCEVFVPKTKEAVRAEAAKVHPAVHDPDTCRACQTQKEGGC